GDEVADEDRRTVAEDRLDAVAAVERVLGLERPGELAVLGEQVGERGVVAVVGVAREQQRQATALAFDRDPLDQLHHPPAPSCSVSISAKASLARRKLSTAAGMPP